MTIEIENVENVLYGSENPTDESLSTEKEDELKIDFETIDLTEVDKFASEASPPEVKEEKFYSPKFTITNYKDYNITNLRNFFDINKYLEDPIAFMKNYVWAPNFNLNNNTLVFDYRLSGDTDINFITNLAIEKVLKDLEPVILDEEGIKQKFIETIGGTAISYTSGPKQTDEQLKLIENYFWLWCSQIFSYNIEKKTGDDLTFKGNAESAKPLTLAAFFLCDYYATGNPKEPLLDYLKNPGFGFPALLGLIKDQVNKRTYENKNNYLQINPPSSIEGFSTVNYINSPFFNNSLQNVPESEKKFFSTPKEVKKCKNALADKVETGLRLFYKEGNDNILNKDVPEGGLGCQTSVLSWTAAQNQIFDIENVKSNILRINLSLPYYNELSIKNNTAIPKQADNGISLSQIIGATDKTVKLYKQNLYLTLIGKSFFDVLVDKDLDTFLDGSLIKLMSNIIESANTTSTLDLSRNFVPFFGQLSVGNIVRKKRLAATFSNDGSQSYFVVDNLGQENNFILYDSQVRYGTKYGYELQELIQQETYEYKYSAEVVVTNSPANYTSIGLKAKQSGFTKNSLKKVGKSKVDTEFSFVDLPPLPTFMNVFPITGVNNKLIFIFENLVSGGVVTKNVPKKLWTEGYEEAKEYYEKQQGIVNPIEEQMYFFKQVLKNIKIYFSKTPPKDLNDLKLFKKIDVFSEGYGKVVNIEPDTKYYFASKSESYTGLESYFSQVYEVEIVDDGGTIFPIIQLYDDLSSKEKRTKELNFGNKFRIEPALLQQAPNPEKNGIGYLSPTVFSPVTETRPQFKIRLTSKKTGRKVDFNIIYKKNFKEASENAGVLNLDQTTKDKVLISYRVDEE